MKITDTTPKVERTFTLELTETELKHIEQALAKASHGFDLYMGIGAALKK